MNFAFRRFRESKKIDKYLDLDSELKMLWDMKVTVIPIVVRGLGTVSGDLVKKLKELEILTTTLLNSIRIHRESHGDMRRLAVTQTPVKNHQLKII